MRFRTAAPAALVLVALAACVTPPPPPPALGTTRCGQTADGKAMVSLAADVSACPAAPGQRQVVTAEACGPTMNGSIVDDDCYRGNIPGRPSPDVWRRGTILANGGTVIVFVASDAAYSGA